MKGIVVPFNRPEWSGQELAFMEKAMATGCVAGNGPFTKKSQEFLELCLAKQSKALLTTSCTHALEMSAILLDLEPGDEVIVPSYTFVSTALAFVMHGGTPVFADIRPDTLNIDERHIERLITDRTRAIVPVHYAGIACEMDAIMSIAERYDLVVIEDNAHGIFGQYNKRKLGSIGHMATLSFHETKNITCGEGGALIINDNKYSERAEIIWEKGTNRSQFRKGCIDKYTWLDKGSSYLMSDILAACLYGQLSRSDDIQAMRKILWDRYNKELAGWSDSHNIQLPCVPDDCEQSYHMFYMLMPSEKERNELMLYMEKQGIGAAFHYLPLHDSLMAKKIAGNRSECPVARDVSKRIIRLPLYSGLTIEEQDYVIRVATSFRL